MSEMSPPKRPIKDILRAAIAINPDVEFGPAHIVIGDYELSDTSIRWCLSITEALLGLRGLNTLTPTACEAVENLVAEYTRRPMCFFEWFDLFDQDEGVLPVTRKCLLELLSVSELEREAFEEED